MTSDANFVSIPVSEFEDLVKRAGLAQQETRSSVQIEETAKGIPMLRTKVYAGESEAEMQRILDLCIATFKAGKRQIGIVG